MEHDFSYTKQFRKEITARAVMNRKTKMVEVDIDENKKKYDRHKEINRIQKSIQGRKQKHRKYRELSLRVVELKNIKNGIRNKIDALNQIIIHIEEVKELSKLRIKELRTKIKNLPKENPFGLTEYVEKQKEDDEVDLGLFLELPEENKIIYNQTPVNTLIENMEN